MALTEMQRYLLSRLPGKYDWRLLDDSEPVEVTRARRVIESFEKKGMEKRQAYAKRMGKLINSAREAIYFKPPEKALEIVKALEAEMDKKS